MEINIPRQTVKTLSGNIYLFTAEQSHTSKLSAKDIRPLRYGSFFALRFGTCGFFGTEPIRDQGGATRKHVILVFTSRPSHPPQHKKRHGGHISAMAFLILACSLGTLVQLKKQIKIVKTVVLHFETKGSTQNATLGWWSFSGSGSRRAAG